MKADQSETQYTHTANGRTWKLYGCAKDGCDAINPDYLSFDAGERSYCLHHAPKTTLWSHRPWPGPWPVWDWRCRVCDLPVADHPSLFAYLWRKLHRPLDNA